MMIYELKGVTKEYSGKKVLDIDSLGIEGGAVTALLGPNGAGKTTLLSILAFLSSPTSGSLTYSGRAVEFSESALQPLRREVVLISQHPIMFTGSVYKNVGFGLRMRGVEKSRRRAMIEKSLELVGMESFAQEKAHKLSGGETQRIAIARALVLSPRVILCDEPIANVDSQNQAVIISLLRQINKEQGITVIFTSHDALWAKDLAHNYIFLDQGGPVSSVLDNIFLGVCEPGASGPIITIANGLKAPAPGNVSGKVRICLDPGRLCIVSSGEKDSAPGIVKQLSMENHGVRVIVDAGVSIAVYLDMDQYKSLGCRIGDRVGLIIPADSVRMLDSSS